MALALLSACAGESDSTPASPAGAAPRAPDPITVAVLPVVRDAMTSSYSTSATLRAERQATVTSRTRGVLEELLVEEGDAVETGQTIAKLDDEEQILAVQRYTATEAIKKREFERVTGLNSQNIVSDNELELVRREAEEAQHDRQLAELNLQRTSIVSPFDGIVVLRHLDVGATVSDGTPIYDLADLDPLYVDVNVPERHVSQLAPDQAVRLLVEALADPVDARIERLAPVVDAGTGTVKVTVAVKRSVALRPGAFVEVDVVTDVHEDALVVPRSALVADGRRWLVFRVSEEGASVTSVEVELGFEDGDRVEIAGVVNEGRLEAGDLVVVLGASALSDGAPIEILERG